MQTLLLVINNSCYSEFLHLQLKHLLHRPPVVISESCLWNYFKHSQFTKNVYLFSAFVSCTHHSSLPHTWWLCNIKLLLNHLCIRCRLQKKRYITGGCLFVFPLLHLFFPAPLQHFMYFVVQVAINTKQV